MSVVLEQTRCLLEQLAIGVVLTEEFSSAANLRSLGPVIEEWMAAVRSCPPYAEANKVCDALWAAEDLVGKTLRFVEEAEYANRRSSLMVLQILSLAAKDYSPDELLRKELAGEPLPFGG